MTIQEETDIFPLRIGRKQSKAVLMSCGRLFIMCKSPNEADYICNLLNNNYNASKLNRKLRLSDIFEAQKSNR